ncbi:MAG: zf-TFIIB domain-containing protein [Myxococcales bacterium]|nr:zf-TFIIB domain-containing protein [Myxococcales bacterium]
METRLRSEIVCSSKLICPRCRERLDAYHLSLNETALEIDACRKCHSMWFDRDEATHLRQLMQDSAIHAEAMNSRKGTIKSYIFQLLTQFPLEVWNPVRHRPVLVYSLLTAVLVTFF